MDSRKSDTPIVPKKPLITVEGRGVHFTTSSETEHADNGELRTWQTENLN